MDKEKVKNLIKQSKKLLMVFGSNIPKEQMDLINNIIKKLESGAELDTLTDEEYSYVKRAYDAVYSK